jgi:hypothetical protein
LVIPFRTVKGVLFENAIKIRRIIFGAGGEFFPLLSYTLSNPLIC